MKSQPLKVAAIGGLLAASSSNWLGALYPESVLLWQEMRLKMIRELKGHTKITLFHQNIAINEPCFIKLMTR